MAEEIAKLVDALTSSSSSDDNLSQRLRSDSSLNLGLHEVYSILKGSVRPIGDGDGCNKLGLELWDQSQIQALTSLATAVVYATRSLSVEQLEPVIVAVVQKSVEFSLYYLEKSIRNNDDLNLQSYMVQLLEIGLIESVVNELDLSQPFSLKIDVELLPIVALKDGGIELQDHLKCMLQGGRCSVEERAVNHLLMTLTSGWMQPDDGHSVGESSHHDFTKLIALSRHQAIVHLECIPRLLSLCKELFELPDLFDEKTVCTNLRKRLSFCVRIFKLLGAFAKDNTYVKIDAVLLQSFASFADVLPKLFIPHFEFSSSATAESSFENLTVLLMEEFLQLVQSIFHNSNVFQNIQACITASILEHLELSGWRYNKSAVSQNPPLVYFPRVVIYMMKLIMDVKNCSYQFFRLKDLDTESAGSDTVFHVNSPACHVHSKQVFLLKRYTVEELLMIIFPSSRQWLETLIYLLFFLHSEGVKLRPKFDGLSSGGPRTSSEPETAVFHEDDALFGDLFSEGGRSGSLDAFDHSTAAASSLSFSNMPIHAATELLIFLKNNVFSPDWHLNVYEDACRKLTFNHIGILLSIINNQGSNSEDRTSDSCIALDEQKKLEHVLQLCFELLSNLLSRHALSNALEEYLIEKVLAIENGAFVYNDQTLALLAHALVSQMGSAASCLRTKIYEIFINFIHEKVKTIFSGRPSIKQLLDTLPSLFHIEILLMAFHLSSDVEKAGQVLSIFSSLRTIEAPSAGFDGMQLSCWALVVSRLVVLLRHMMYYRNGCPSSLLLEFRSKLREAPHIALHHPSCTTKSSSWTPIMLENVMGAWMKEAPVSKSLLKQLIDIAPLPVSVCSDDPPADSLELTWDEICTSFSWILGFWRGKKPGNVEDLLLERYIFVLCWDIPVLRSTSEHLQLCLKGPEVPDILEIDHFVYFSHSILAHSGAMKTNFPDMVLGLLQHMHALCASDDHGQQDWDFFRAGSWLSLILSLFGAGISGHLTKNSIDFIGPSWREHSSRDAEFLALAEDLVSSLMDNNQISVLLRLFSSFLNKYLAAYQRAFILTFDKDLSSADGFSPLFLLKHTCFDKCKQDDLLEKMGYNPRQLESLYELLTRLDETINRTGLGFRYSLFLEFAMHGFPCHPQFPSGILLSCIISIKGIVGVLDGFLKVRGAEGIIGIEAEALDQIFKSILTIKCDRVFESLHGKCEAIYKRLSSGIDGHEYSSLFKMKNMEEILCSVNNRGGVDNSIYDCFVTNFIDVVNSFRKDPAKAHIFKRFPSVEDGSKQFRDIHSVHCGDLLVLMDSLDSCNSESVNVKVLNFFVDLLSGDVYVDVKRKLHQKFLCMDLLLLSKWLERRLLGTAPESSGGVACAKGTSVSLRESTMSFIMCLVSMSSETESQELPKHLFEAMLVPLESAFLLFDFSVAKSYFNFVLQLFRGEMSIRPLLQRIIMLMEKLHDNENLLEGLKYIFGFLGTILSEMGSTKNTVDKSSGRRTLSSNTSGLGPVSSRPLGSRKSSDALVLSANQGASAGVDCDATSLDEDEDDGTSDGEVASVDKDDEDDSSSERALASKVCTFTSSGSNFMEQHWYFCYTCDLTVSKGCCSVCAKVCHRGHRVVYSRSSRFFCDCGAGGVRGNSCQCLKPRKFTAGNNVPSRGAGYLQSFMPFPENGDQLPDSDSEVDEDTLVEVDNSIQFSIPKEVQDGIPKLLGELDVEDRVIELCSILLPSITSRRDSNLSKERKISLGGDKVLAYNADLLQLKKAYKSGSLDLKVKADYSNTKELKSHLASGSLVKSLLSVSSRGRLAVGEGDKVAIFDVGQLIGQATVAPVTADKANVKPLSKNVVRFEIVHLDFNLMVDNYLAVAGYEDCQVLAINHRGEVTDRLAIELALQGAYIRRVDWVPGSQVQLMVVTNKFVKIYDLSQDNISPMHYFTLPDDMVVDATLLMASNGRVFLLVLSENGYLYRLELSMKGNVGIKALKEIIQIEGKDMITKGLSLCFSPSQKLLFVSYQDGSTLIGRLNSDATSLTEVSAVFDNESDGKIRPAGLHRWKELLSGTGLFTCFSSVKSNSAFALSIGENEVLAQNLRHAVGSTSPLVGITAYRPLSKDKIHCLVLHEDGSLQIYSHVPMGVDTGSTAISDKVKKLGSDILNNKAYGGTKPDFPLDFFEKTMCITPDVKLSGDAVSNGDSEGAKQAFTSEDGFLESPSPSGFKITVSNSNPDIVMVGFRIHVGNTSANYIPSEVTIFQRVIKLEEGMRSWYDMPFTVAESLLADEEFTICVGPTPSGSSLARIDSLEVYGRSKDEFGWKEKMDAVLDMESHALSSNSWISGSRRKGHYTQTAPLQEQVIADGLKLLSRIYSCKSQECSKGEELKVDLSKLKCRKLLETIFESDREHLLLAAAACVLQALFPKKEMYHQVKDTMRLGGVVESTSILSSKLGTGGNSAGWIVEEFTAQMRAVSKIALHRRSNLAAFLDANGSEVVDGLMQVLWGILDLEQPDTQTMNNIVVSSVELIYCYAECLALQATDKGRHSVTPAVSLFKELQFSTNEAVQTSSSLAISSRLLQVPFPKQMMLGTDDTQDNPASVPVRADNTGVTSGNGHLMVEEDNITSSVQYCCDGCSTVPILRRRWHCTVCPDFDLCESCYEVLDADGLPPPHSRDHPMTAIPIEVESLGGEGNEIHFPTDDLADPNLLRVSTDMSMQNAAPTIHELEPIESADFSASVVDPVTISASKRVVNSLLLSELLEQLKGWMVTTSGVRAIPIMQLFYRLSSAIGGPFADSLEPEHVDLEKLIKWFLDEINLNKPFAARNRSSSGEVLIIVFMFFTLMLRNWNQPGSEGSVPKSSSAIDAHDKSTIQVTPSSISGSPAADGQGKNDFVSHLFGACALLRQQAFVNYLMDILQQLVHVFKSSSFSTDNSTGLSPGSGCGSLLTVRRELPAGNFSPFFSDAYAKSHRADIFADYPRLLLENTFRLVYSLIRPEKHDKGGEKDKSKASSMKDLKLDGYQDILCSYINNQHTSFVRRYARRLFLHLCGSKTHYYSVRDTWQFSSEVKKLYKHVNKSGGFQNTISYERSVKIVKCLSTMAEVAAARPRNWQKYCTRHVDVLPFLMNGVFYFGEECVVQTLKLLSLVFYTGKDIHQSLHKAEAGEAGTTSNKSGSQPLDVKKKKKKGEDGSDSSLEKSYLEMESATSNFADKDGETLRQFIDLFLLEWNSSSVRVEAKCVLFGIWHHGNQSFKESMLTILLRQVKFLPMYGQNIVEYADLVTSMLGKTLDNSSKQQINEIVDKCLTVEVIRCIFETLRSQNELLANHPNSRIYSTLSGLVEFDGYYLESEPCVACSSPEVPYTRMKLENLKSETKFTDNRIIVKCTGSYTIQSVTMNVHDARKSKSVKVLNLYYNNRPVADLSELKNNWSLWKRAKTCHLSFNQTELKVDFPIPITACNFMIELDLFYENLQALSLEPLQCPRCSRPVTDKHGICSNCHENAYQCRQCRNINYENRDSFLCNECGYSKYGRFEFYFMAKPSFTFDNMENDEDMKRGLMAIESESENAHRRYQQLLGFKKPLLKIVSSIGENEMDSQQKDSVQQMMVSLPGPSCKINRKIALLGVLYGEKCKAAFDSVSKSVQTLQGLRRVLMNYLHLKNSDNAVGVTRFVMSRSANSCYGCATTFVTQCLEMLQVLSKHPSSKKQLVSAGILSELFENNIHQGPKTARVQARTALCAFSEGDMNAVAELNHLIQKKVIYCLEHHRSMDVALATHEELLLLSEMCSLADEFWESRLRVVFQLLFSSIKLGAQHPVISEYVILPCLRIISLACTPPKPDAGDKEHINGKSSSEVKEENHSNASGTTSCLIGGSKSLSELSERNWDGSQKAQDIQLLSYSEWEGGASYLDFVRRQYKVSQAVKSGPRSRPHKYDYLALKYALRWKQRACKTRSEIASFELGSWVTELILSSCSQSIRSEMCMLISLLCGQSSSRRYRLLNLLSSLLPASLAAGENAAEYFELLFKMIDSEDACLFLTVRGSLTTICKLITQEVTNIESFERSLHIDISQGFILHKLIELLGKFLEVRNIRSRFMREELLSEVLEALIVIRGLIVQKTKLISDCNRLLKDLLDSLLLESNENKSQFIQACICGLQIHGNERKGRTSLFILEQLCNLICPSKPEAVYFLILNKAHTQEEFIRGSMTKNPYSSAEIGPLMRDVKNKICHQLDLLGLLEDDFGMELLVGGNIISLDLSIAQVYEQVWRKSNSQSSNALVGALLSSSGSTSSRDCPPMIVTYRLQGLDGEATEPMIKELDEDREESQDPEVEFAIAGAVRECGGLEIILGMVQSLRDDLKSNQEQLVAVLNLLMLCCKIRENRRALLRVGALSLLLETARHAFSVDAMEPAESIMLIVESLTLEANESDNISITPGVSTVSTEETGVSEQAKKIVIMFLERLSCPSGLKKSSKQQRNTEMIARILPYLTYGEPTAMEALIQHFDPYLQNWDEFDRLQKQYEDNPGGENIAQQAANQKFALENFVRVSESLKTSSCGERLKDIILEKGITGAGVRHLKDTFEFTGQVGFRSSSEWVLGLKLPSVPLILSMLRGLSMGHLATQSCIDEGGILPLLHALEGVAGENEIGARAENLLDTLSDKEGKGDGFLAEKVCQLRHATRDEMRRRALRKREELLQGLGMRQELSSDGGERIIVARPVLEGLEDVEEEEDGLACMVCREGYLLRPTDLLGVYTYSKRVNLGVGTSGSTRGDFVYTTVSHFNIIHFQCHQEAKRADAALKNPKKEWDGATLRNSETLCNNLFPLRGPSAPISQYIRYVDQYWDYLNALGRADGSRLRLLSYDIVLMLARFATGASFSADSRGGGKESNSRFLPFMIQMARHFLDHDPPQRHAMTNSISIYLASPTSESKPSSGFGTRPASGTEETVQFMMVTSLLSESYESWLQHRRAFLQRGLYHAYMQHTHGRSMTRTSPNMTGALRSDISSTTGSHSGETGGSDELLAIIQPMLVYTGLIEQLQRFFKVKKSSTVAAVETQVPSKALEVEDENRGLEVWEVLMKERLLNVKEMVDFSKEILSWLEDMTSATDLQEALDMIGVLADVLTGGYARCEEFVHAAISAGKS